MYFCMSFADVHIVRHCADVCLQKLFANGPVDQGSIRGGVIPKTQKMVLDAALLNTQHYMIRIKGKVEQCRDRSSALLYTSV